METKTASKTFNYMTEEHGLIADSVRRLLGDLSVRDEQSRQRSEAAEVVEALDGIGLFSLDRDDAGMASAQVQVLVAREAGVVSLPCPILESLAVHAVVGRWECKEAPLRCAVSSRIDDVEDATLLLGGRLSGHLSRVPFLDAAEGLWVRARSESGKVLVLVSARDPGIQAREVRSVEPDYRLHDLQLRGVAALKILGKIENGVCATRFLDLRAGLLAAAEVSGACQRMVMMTRDYLLTRSQFGQVLGGNQALRHALADAHVRVEALSTAVDYAAAACDADAGDAESAVQAAKHFAGRAGKFVADTTLQLHGAIGYTMEFPLQLLMRRVHRLGASHGSTRQAGEGLFKAFQSHR